MNVKTANRDRENIMILLVLFFVLLLFSGCAALRTVVKGPPLTAQQIRAILSEIDDQQERVSSFYTLGTVLLKDGILEAEADALIVGTRDPFRLKIELTHSWGKPLLHILVDGGHLAVLSFKDRKLYVGTLSPETLSRFLPGGLDASMTWAVLRGYPDLLQSSNIISREANRILVLDGKGTVIQSVDLSEEDRTPTKVRYLRQGVQVDYEGYRSDGEIRYAQEIRVDRPENNKSSILTRKKTVFNKAIPEAIFALKRPPNFDEVSIEEIH